MGLQATLYNKTAPSRFRILLPTLVALLVTCLFFFVVGHSLYNYRKVQQRDVARSDVAYAARFADDMQKRIENLLPLSRLPCKDVYDNLSSSAAFAPGVRTYLLVRHGVAYCSSATRTMFIPVKHIYPELNLSQPSDIRLQQGTPIIHDKPVLAAWMASGPGADTGVIMTLDIDPAPYMLFFARERTASGLALIVQDRAISTFAPGIIKASALPNNPSVSLSDPERNRFSFRLYGRPLSSGDISWLTSLTALFFALAWMTTYYILSQRTRADRDILRGIKNREFFLVYQPVIHADDMSIGGIEILIRWKHPRLGLIPPDQFIPYCEAQGLIIPLTRYILAQVAREAHQLTSLLSADVKLGINIAPSQLTDPDFRGDVLEFLSQLPPAHFQAVFEITERSMVQHGDAEEIFDWLHQQNVAISIDDFGTGHSALIYLERYKIDYLKIDRGFIHSIGMDTVTAPVLDAVLSLAEKLQLRVVAEGVENEEQAEYLRKRGVHYFQGFLYCRPIPLAQLQDFIRHWQRPAV
ncbi:cyclic di-GMP phosphodiesterase [Enterobacillus tribolii]|nr:cyclic di-GMP phosphodiesterase [Enterobacillus tribolii]MBW7984663.1 cyclic di-GMP phosphodiesterase [Enterobacillus tribolii]